MHGQGPESSGTSMQSEVRAVLETPLGIAIRASILSFAAAPLASPSHGRWAVVVGAVVAVALIAAAAEQCRGFETGCTWERGYRAIRIPWPCSS